MLSLQPALWACLAIASGIIAWQDFRDRLVSLWVLLVFGLLCIFSVVVFRDLQSLLYNGIGCVLYFLLVWLMLKLYFYLKYRQPKAIVNELLGMADVLVMLFIGCTFNLTGLILFFCAGFVFSLTAYVIYTAIYKSEANTPIPLAGLLVIFYGLTIIVLHLVKATDYIDCSFVNL